MCQSLPEMIKNEKKETKVEAEAWCSCTHVKLSSCEDGKHSSAILHTTCKLYPPHHITCACASCGGPSAPQEQEELVAWARKCPVWSQLEFHFCQQDPSCRAQRLLLYSMHFSHSPSPCTTGTCQHMCLCVLCGSACFSGAEGSNPCLITCRLRDFVLRSFPVVTELPNSHRLSITQDVP